MTEEQEQHRLAELRSMEADGIGTVSLLAHETTQRSKMAFFKRLRAAKAALREIQANPADAQRIAAAALAADDASIHFQTFPE